MFCKAITGSAKFIKMPQTSQNLYWHLAQNADDDGIVEAYNIMKMIGATEDDLHVLVAKGFVVVLNEDLVTYITDWQEHNSIRPDRKIDSQYKDLLVQLIPDIQLIEAKPRADRPHEDPAERTHEKGRRQAKEKWDSNGTAMGPHRIGEDRIGKERENTAPTLISEFQKAIGNIPASQKDECVKFLRYWTQKDQEGREKWQSGHFDVKLHWENWLDHSKTNFGHGRPQTEEERKETEQKRRAQDDKEWEERRRVTDEINNLTPEQEAARRKKIESIKAQINDHHPSSRHKTEGRRRPRRT